MPKGPRQDTLVEKCTELGVAEVWPMLCDRSVVKPETGRLARWRRTAIEASKQSGRAWLPEIQPVQQFTDVLALFDRYEATLIAHLNVSAGDAVSPPDCSTVLVLVGPEGGFCAEEYADALAHGAAHLDLGGTILRTETAAIAAVARLTRV
jgi:16S rRNA (uracil1498-N3)-methyltransferase